MREVIIEVTVKVMGAIVMGVLGVVFAYLGKLAGKSKKLDHISAAMCELEKVVKTVVGDLQQTVVEKLKADSEDGKLTPDEIESLGSMLLYKVANQLSVPAGETITAAGIDLENAIHSIAEAYIEKIKREANFIAIGEVAE